jgi:hypothetical protein
MATRKSGISFNISTLCREEEYNHKYSLLYRASDTLEKLWLITIGIRYLACVSLKTSRAPRNPLYKESPEAHRIRPLP